MDEEMRQALKLAALIMAGAHSDTAQAMLEAAMLEVAGHRAGAGVGAHGEWVKALRLLGETCLSLAKQQVRG